MSAIPRAFTLMGTGAGGTPTFNGWTSTGTGVFTSAATGGLQIYNTADQTTNYERLNAFFTSNVAVLGTTTGGTGTGRDLVLSAQGSLGAAAFPTIRLSASSFPTVRFGANTTQTGTTPFSTTGAGVSFLFVPSTNTATSGTAVGLSITPTYNQSSGTAANTDLLINRTQTAAGSGTQRLIDAQVGGTSLFSVSNAGFVSAALYSFGASKSYMDCASDGVIGIRDSAGTSFNRLQFGGTTASFPSIKRNSAGLDLRVADDSAYAGLTLLNLVATSSIVSIGATQGVGYGTGAGGTVTQATSKVTAFTLSKMCGAITFAGDILNANTTTAGATWTCSGIAAGDTVLWNHVSGGTLGAYDFIFTPGAGTCTVRIRNVTAGNLTEAPVIQYSIIKAVQA